MAVFYRFRSIEQLLGEFEELKNQTIYFASPEELNDPMEGLQDIVWEGDRIVWRNLFKNYVNCLHWYFEKSLTGGEEVLTNPQSVPYAPERFAPPPLEERGLTRAIWGKIEGNGRLRNLVARLGDTKKRVRQEELLQYLRAIHAPCLEGIRDMYIANGVVSAEQWPYRTGHYKASPTPIEIIDQAGRTQDPKHRESLYNIVRHEQADPVLFRMDLFDGSPRLMSRIPMLFLEHLKRFVMPRWYTACFTTNINNASMWSHYGDRHRGACLIFKADETRNVPGMVLDRSGRTIGRKTFHRVRYGDRLGEIDFFGFISNLPDKLLNSWHRDEDGHLSICAGERAHGQDESALLHMTSKTKDWEYENEYRLIIDGGHSRRPMEKADRTLTYDFLSLEGIIPGMDVSTAHKREIESIVGEKGIENNRPAVVYHQAYYSPHHGEIRCKQYWSMLLPVEGSGPGPGGSRMGERAIQEVWNKSVGDIGQDPDQWRQDEEGRTISRSDYGNRDSKWGWFIDHITPLSQGGSDALENLRPLNYRSIAQGNEIE